MFEKGQKLKVINENDCRFTLGTIVEVVSYSEYANEYLCKNAEGGTLEYYVKPHCLEALEDN